jgi:hypothetical protein
MIYPTFNILYLSFCLFVLPSRCLSPVDARARPAIKIGYRAFRPKNETEMAECMDLASGGTSASAESEAAPPKSAHTIWWAPDDLEELLGVLRSRHQLLPPSVRLQHSLRLAFLCRLHRED